MCIPSPQRRQAHITYRAPMSKRLVTLRGALLAHLRHATRVTCAKYNSALPQRSRSLLSIVCMRPMLEEFLGNNGWTKKNVWPSTQMPRR